MSEIYCKSGDNLTKEELAKIKDNYIISPHAWERMQQRKLHPKEIPNALDNPYKAFYNIDGSIILARHERSYLIFRYDSKQDKYIMITYAGPSKEHRVSVSKKQMLAKLKIKTPGKNRV